MDAVETLDIDGYTVEIHYDDDPVNPLKEFDGQPTLVLHDKAESHFGWTNDDDWHRKLNCALEDIAERGHTKGLHGPRGALAVLNRWMRAYHGIQVVLPVGAGEHSGTWAYLGDGASLGDAGGWDSGWVGWLFATPQQLAEWNGPGRLSDERVTETLEASFKEFADWVSGACYGYIATNPDGEEIGSSWGYYGSESYDERVETELVLTQRPIVGWVVKTFLHSGDDRLTQVEDTEDPNEWLVRDATAGVIGRWRLGMTITLVGSGYMREAFMADIEADRAKRTADETEIDELRLAEVGA